MDIGKKSIRLAALLTGAAIFASCQMPVVYFGTPKADLRLAFIMQGIPAYGSSGRSMEGKMAPRLLLPTAATLVVTLMPQNPSLPTYRTDPLSDTEKDGWIQVSIDGVAYGRYTINAVAYDADGGEVFWQTSVMDVSANSHEATLNLLPVNIQEGGIATVPTAQAVPVTIAGGQALTWLVPSQVLASLSYRLFTDAGADVLVFAQRGDGVLLNNGESASRSLAVSVGASSDSLVTFYNGAVSPETFRFVVNAFSVIYGDNGSSGGSVPVDAKGYVEADTATVLGNTGPLVRTGYSFTGWNTQADGLGTDRAADSTFAMGTGNATLYAKWTVNSFTVTFDSQGGSAVTGTSADYGALISSPIAPTWTGHTFGGWYKETATTNPWVFGTDTVTAATTLYAKWTELDLSGLTVNVSLNNPSQPSVSVAGQAVTLNKNASAVMSVNLTAAGCTDFVWWIDNGPESPALSGNGTTAVTIDSALLGLGTHNVSLIFNDAAGEQYSEPLFSFTVVYE